MTDLKTEGLARIGAVELGAFRLDKIIGTGGYAFAYEAHDLRTNGRAVVKVAQKALVYGMRGQEIRSRFESEARAAASVAHPSLPRIYAAGLTQDGLPAIAMEFVEGELLEHLLLRPTPMSLAQFETCFVQLADALRMVHAVGVIHRDVTPRNIIWSPRHDGYERPMLLDFGIAKLPGRSHGTLGGMGTPGFMAPEQLLGQASTRSDIFALGACMWWAATGRAFLSQFHSIEDLFRYQMGERKPPDAREADPDMPEELAELLGAMLDPVQEKRIGADALVPAALDVLPRLRGRWQPHTANVGGLERDLEETLTPRELATLVRRTPDHRPAEIVVVSDDTTMLRLVTAHVRGLGRQVMVSQDPEMSGPRRHVPDAVFVVATELHFLDGYDVATQLRADHPRARIFLVSRRDEGARWLKTAAHQFFVLPAELDRFGEAVQEAFAGRFRPGGNAPPMPINHATIDQLVHRADRVEIAGRIELFIDQLPQRIGMITEALRKDRTGDAQEACAWLSSRAGKFGADRLADLAQVVHALLGEGEVLAVDRLLKDLTAEHARVHRALLLARGQLLRDVSA
jgi:DNA-binding NarL/FixJ family response regulator